MEKSIVRIKKLHFLESKILKKEVYTGIEREEV